MRGGLCVCTWVCRTGDGHGLIPFLLILPPLARHVPHHRTSSPLHPSIHLLTITEAPAVIRPATRALPEAPRVLIPEEKQLLVRVRMWGGCARGEEGKRLFGTYCCILGPCVKRRRPVLCPA